MDKCNALAAAYDDARDNALACSVTSPDCTQRITNDLKCGLSSYANANANVESFKTDWTKWQCGMIDWKCPMYSSLPPGTQVFGVCNIAQGQCETQYVFPK